TCLVEGGPEVGDCWEGFHASQTGVVQRFEHAQGSEKELPTAAGRVKNGEIPQGVPEHAQQRGISLSQQIGGEPGKIDISRQEIVDGSEAAPQSAPDVVAAPAAGNVLAPGFCWQGILRQGRTVPVGPS